MRISDWSSDVCSSDLSNGLRKRGPDRAPAILDRRARDSVAARAARAAGDAGPADHRDPATGRRGRRQPPAGDLHRRNAPAALTSARARSEEHTSELQSLMRISYAVLCLKKKKPN